MHTPPRKHLCRREFADGYRFVTFSCYRQLPLLGTPRLRKAFTDAVRAAASRPAWRLLAYAVMPEHVHMVARTQGQPLGEILNSIKSSVANRVLRHWRAVNAPILDRLAHPSGGYRFWQHGGGFDRNVRDDAELCRAIRYVHDNPADRGLVPQPEDWEWSSLRWWMGRHALIECQYPSDDVDWRAWRGYVTPRPPT